MIATDQREALRPRELEVLPDPPELVIPAHHPDPDPDPERVQALRPVDVDPEPATAPAADVLKVTCAVCRTLVFHLRGQASQALTEHYTARQHTDGAGGRG